MLRVALLGVLGVAIAGSALSRNSESAPRLSEIGLSMTAQATMVPPEGAGNPYAPKELKVVLTIANVTPLWRSIWVSPCTAWVKIYRVATRDDSGYGGKMSGTQCYEDRRHVRFAPFQRRRFLAEGNSVRLRMPSMPTGWYRVTAVVDRLRDLKEVDAGWVNNPDHLAGIDIAAVSELTDGHVDVRANIRNTSKAPVYVEYGACSMNVMAFRSLDRTGKPAWIASNRPGAGACVLYLKTGELKPGEILEAPEFRARFTASDILGDSLPGGDYYLSAAVGLNWTGKKVPAGMVTLTR